MPGKKFNPTGYNRRVTVQTRTVVNGESVWYADDSYDVWACVSPFRGREYIAAGALSAPEIITVKTWYRDNVNAEDNRLVYGGKVFNIENVVDVDAAHREMELTCTEEIGAVMAIPRP